MSAGHLLARRVDPAEVTAAGLVQAVAVVLEQRIAVPAQRPQRGAQVMGDRVAERLQAAVRLLQFGRALRDTGFESALSVRASSSASRCAVMSRATATISIGLPSGARTVEWLTSVQTTAPSLRR